MKYVVKRVATDHPEKSQYENQAGEVLIAFLHDGMDFLREIGPVFRWIRGLGHLADWYYDK
jgi:hypothetical protein